MNPITVLKVINCTGFSLEGLVNRSCRWTWRKCWSVCALSQNSTYLVGKNIAVTFKHKLLNDPYMEVVEKAVTVDYKYWWYVVIMSRDLYFITVCLDEEFFVIVATVLQDFLPYMSQLEPIKLILQVWNKHLQRCNLRLCYHYSLLFHTN